MLGAAMCQGIEEIGGRNGGDIGGVVIAATGIAATCNIRLPGTDKNSKEARNGVAS